MSIHFHVHYITGDTERLAIEYQTNKSNDTTVAPMNSFDGSNWGLSLDISKNTVLSYRYLVLKDNIFAHKEWGQARSIVAASNTFVEDTWSARNVESNAFLSSAFTKVIFKRQQIPTLSEPIKKVKKSGTIQFKLISGAIPSSLVYGIIGNIPELGSWTSPVLLSDHDYPAWTAEVPLAHTSLYIEYKYVIYDSSTGRIVEWESGENRKKHLVLPADNTEKKLVITDQNFVSVTQKPKLSGVAIPVFSLRSEKGLGIGEFDDIKDLVLWSQKVGMKVIQILPINDTIANKTWQDSYPYAAISVFALHPLYININSIATLKNKAHRDGLQQITQELNALETVDFERVLEYKFKYFRLLFLQEKESFLKDKSAALFMEENKAWLQAYAAFCHLRDKNKTCQFDSWPQFSTYDDSVLTELCSPTYEGYDEILFYYFIQYHADKQLLAAKNFAREHSVVLKGDLPIGIYRYSCDAWVAPHLYNMDEQAGAPPDDYAVLGQNWGFPTYNWTVMAQNGFKWWRSRMQQLNRYFDAMRIDHILGFFRIWQIPTNQVEGTMGLFNPRLPYSLNELAQYGLYGDLTRYTKPHITRDILSGYFGQEVDFIIDQFFTQSATSDLEFKPEFDNQTKVLLFIAANMAFKPFEERLFRLLTEVLLIAEPNTNNTYFNPRITLPTTTSYQHLDHNTKRNFDALYNDYFFNRHDQYWKNQAEWKLPAILDASEMLICGEDLGMIPKSVPGVMNQMNIIALEIQRMPKGDSRFGQVAHYPYFSVCSPSCHDMSTIRGWWESDQNMAKDFYYQYLHWSGFPPADCSPEIVESIIRDHLASPSMLAIMPIQDLVGMSGSLRKNDASSEQINEPSNPKHYWRYRFHMNLSSLLEADDLNNKIKVMNQQYGR